MKCSSEQSQHGKTAGGAGAEWGKVQVMVQYVYGNGIKHTMVSNCHGCEA